MIKTIFSSLVKKIVFCFFVVSTGKLYANNTLVYCTDASPESFNPQLVTSGASMDATAVPIYNRLVQFKLGTTEIEPSLAKSWEISEDGKTYTFYLRDDVTWQSNQWFTPTRRFNADDVIFSFMRQKDPNHPYHSVSGGQYSYFNSLGRGDLIESIEKIDDYTVAYHLSRPETPFLANNTLPFNSILSAEYGEKMLIANTPEKLDLAPIGTGPFKLSQYQKDSRILFTPHKDYFGTHPKLKRFVFSIVPDPAVRYAKLKKEECLAMPYPNLSDIKLMQHDQNIQLDELDGMNITYLAFNMDKKGLSDLKVRQALSMTINKEAIINSVFLNTAIPAINFIPPSLWGYNPEIKDDSYDQEKAKQLLKEAGFENGLTINLWAAYRPNMRRMAEVIQAEWAKIGVKANIIGYEWGEFLARAKAGEHDAILMTWTGINGDPDNFFSPLLSCNAKEAGMNYARFCNQDFDKAIESALIDQNHENRIVFYQKAQQILKDNLPVMNIAHSKVFMPHNKTLKNYVMDPLNFHNFNQVELEGMNK